jgi:hypothetical protein
MVVWLQAHKCSACLASLASSALFNGKRLGRVQHWGRRSRWVAKLRAPYSNIKTRWRNGKPAQAFVNGPSRSGRCVLQVIPWSWFPSSLENQICTRLSPGFLGFSHSSIRIHPPGLPQPVLRIPKCIVCLCGSAMAINGAAAGDCALCGLAMVVPSLGSLTPCGRAFAMQLPRRCEPVAWWSASSFILTAPARCGRFPVPYLQ